MQLLLTKLRRPASPGDLVHRPRLLDGVNRGLSQPLTLISAPAGYGKTVLASSVLDSSPLPHTWLSLDRQDNDLRVFLEYVLEAIESVFPQALQRTRSILSASTLPPAKVMATSLINELLELDREFVLVLDDAHLINNPDVLDLLAALLQNPPEGLHLVLVTRRDLPLPLDRLRAYGHMTEIRSSDLRFSAAEIAEFFSLASDVTVSDNDLALLVERTDGWAAALRLAVLALLDSSTRAEQAAILRVENRYVTGYMMSEVPASLPDEIEGFLLRTSILDALCTPLCDAIMEPHGLASHSQAHLEWLVRANMFTESLDGEQIWYRYHGLFRRLLRNELTRRLDAEEIQALHLRASAWYAGQRRIQQAVLHALAGQDTQAAVQLVAQHRHDMLDSEQRPRLERWLRLFPSEVIAEDPDLLLAKAWIIQLGRFDAQTVLGAVAQAQTLVDQMADQPERTGPLLGEINTLLGMQKNFQANDPQGVIALTSQALESLPPAWYLVRVQAWLHLALAYQMSGQLDKAQATFSAARVEDTAVPGSPRARIITSSCFVHWIAADLPSLIRAAHAALRTCQDASLSESCTWSHHFLACAYYQRNDLAAAERHARAVEERRYAAHPTCVLHNGFVLAAVQQARGLPEQALQVLERANTYLLETRSEPVMPVHDGYHAELALAQGDLDTAAHWARTVGPLVPLGIMGFFYAPQLTLPKVLLAMNTPASRQQAGEALAKLRAFVTAAHNTRFTIEVLALQALLHAAEGDEPAGLQALEQAVLLAQPGGLVRVFVDLGPSMAGLFEQLAIRGIAEAHVEHVLEAFRSAPFTPLAYPGGQPRPSQAHLIEPLTGRELEVLELLARRLSNKEIAQRLVVSPETVKRHTANIYQKLGVHSRRDAVEKARSLRILPQREAPPSQSQLVP